MPDTKAAHTPGPWVVVENDGAYVKRNDLARIRIEERATDSELVLALVVTDCERLLSQGEANARLISAAPCLLSALRDLAGRCERARELLRHQGDLRVLDTTAARAAVARATGEGD